MKLKYILQEEKKTEEEKEVAMVQRLRNYYRNTYKEGSSDKKFIAWVQEMLKEKEVK